MLIPLVLSLRPVKNRMIREISERVAGLTHGDFSITGYRYIFPVGIKFQNIHYRDSFSVAEIKTLRVKFRDYSRRRNHLSLSVGLNRSDIQLNSRTLSKFTADPGNKNGEGMPSEAENRSLTVFLDSRDLNFCYNLGDSLQFINVSVGKLRISNVNYQTLKYRLTWNNLEIDSACTSLVLPGPDTTDTPEDMDPWIISGKSVVLKNIYLDVIRGEQELFLSSFLNELEIRTPLINLKDKIIRADRLTIETLDYMQSLPYPVTSAQGKSGGSLSDWTIGLRKADFGHISFFHQNTTSGIPVNDSLARTIGITDFSAGLKEASINADEAILDLTKLSFRYNKHFQLDDSDILLKTNARGTTGSILLRSGESELNIRLRSKDDFLDITKLFPLPDLEFDLGIRSLEPTLYHAFLPDSLVSRLSFLTWKVDMNVKAHTYGDRLEIDTLSLMLGDVLSFRSQLEIDQYHLVDSLIFSGNSQLWVKGAMLSELPFAGPQETILKLSDENYHLSGTILGTKASVHLIQKLSSTHFNIPFEASFYSFDTSFTALISDFRFNGESLLSLPFSVEHGMLDVSGKFGNIPELEFSGNLSEFILSEYDLKGLDFKGNLDEEMLTAGIHINDSAIDAISFLQVQFADTLNLYASGNFQWNNDFLLRNNPIVSLSGDFEAGFQTASGTYYNGQINLSEMRIAGSKTVYDLKSAESTFTGNEFATNGSLKSDFINAGFHVALPVDSLQVLWHNNPAMPLFSDSLSLISYISDLPLMTIDLQLENHGFLNEIILNRKAEFEFLEISVVAEKAYDKKVDLRINGLHLANSTFGSVGISAGLSGSVFIVDGNLNNIESKNLLLKDIRFHSELLGNSLNSVLSGSDKDEKQRLMVDVDVSHTSPGYTLTFPGKSIMVFGETWECGPGNKLRFRYGGIPSGNIMLTSGNSSIELGKSTSCPYILKMERIDLSKLARLFGKTDAIKGLVTGSICLTDSLLTSINAIAEFSDLTLGGQVLGNYHAMASLSMKDTVSIGFESQLKRNSEELITAHGTIDRKEPVLSEVFLEIKNLHIAYLESFLDKYLNELSGSLTGTFIYNGRNKQNFMEGTLIYNDLSMNPMLLNSRFQFADDTLFLKDRIINLNELTVFDPQGKKMRIGGFIDMSLTDKSEIQLSVRGDSMQIMNLPDRYSNEYFGRVIASGDIQLKGALTAPEISLSLRFIEGTDFTFRILEDLDTDVGAGVVYFTSAEEEKYAGNLRPSLAANSRNLTLKANAKIDSKSKFNLIYEQNMRFDIALSGNADLHYSSDRSGNETMTGNYAVSAGEAILKLQGLSPRKFIISPQSFVRWDGLTSDPYLDIKAYYRTKGSYVNPVSGMDKTVLIDYDVLFAVKDRMSEPDIIFDVRTEDEYMTAVLNSMSEDARLKQAINLLLLGQIITGDTKITGASLISDRLNQFWAKQLNEAASKNLSGVDLSVDINSYTAYSAIGAEERTDLSYEVSKDLWNDRATVKVGGYVRTGSENPGEKQSRLLGDVLLEYQLNENRENLYAKLFRKNKYEGILEGEIQITGVGLLYRQDYKSLSEIWKRRQNRKPGSNKSQ
jgi:hypothetical protein